MNRCWRRAGTEVVGTKQLWTVDDLSFALEQAAGFLEQEEWPEEDGGAQVAANLEGARRIRAMVKRLNKRTRKKDGK